MTTASEVTVAAITFDAQRGPDGHALSDSLQGLALDPLAVAAPEGELTLFHQRFIEASTTVSAIAANGAIKPAVSASLTGLVNDAVPVAFSMNGVLVRNRAALSGRDDQQAYTFTGWLGTELSPRLNMALSLGKSRGKTKYTFSDQQEVPSEFSDEPDLVSTDLRRHLHTNDTSATALLGMAIADRTRVVAAASWRRSDLTLDAEDNVVVKYDFFGFPFENDFTNLSRRATRSTTFAATAEILSEFGGITVNAGAEALSRSDQGTFIDFRQSGSRDRFLVGRAVASFLPFSCRAHNQVGPRGRNSAQQSGRILAWSALSIQ